MPANNSHVGLIRTHDQYVAHWRLTDEQKKLAEENYRYAFWVVRQKCQMARELIGEDEVDALAMEALVRAARAFDPNAGFSFRTYAGEVIRREVGRGVRTFRLIHIPEHALSKAARPNETEAAERVKNLSIMGWGDREVKNTEPLAPEHESEFCPEDFERLHDLFRFLTKKQRLVLSLRFGKAHTLLSISRMFKCSRENIRQIELAAITKLRRIWLRRFGPPPLNRA